MGVTLTSSPLHILFFPFMGYGHMMPMVDMAKLFASKGVKATIITTPLNAPLISKAIENSNTHCNQINILTIKFPAEAGLPDGCENTHSMPSPDFFAFFLKATGMLQEPFEQQLHQQRPDCVIADMFFPWATDSAAKLGIPRIVFHGFGYFSLCASECVRLYQPHKKVSSDSESFVMPNFPGELKITRLQVPNFDDEWEEWLAKICESEVSSYGVVVNSFYELEHVYADYYGKVLGRREWHIGPLCLCNNNSKEEKTYRGKDASLQEHELQKWLDTKKASSVVYVCFGSTVNFTNSQLRETAMGLEASGQQFIWVVRRSKKDGEDGEEWLPEGFEKRMEGKGLIIRGWAPQVLILEHEAIGAFMTHCGWNSILEGVTAGVPLVTWPVSAEQFYNEKLVTEVLKIGVSVGVEKWTPYVGDNSIKWDAIKKALEKIMARDEATEEIRIKAKMFALIARQAVEEGGSSCSDLNALIDELGTLRQKRLLQY